MRFKKGISAIVSFALLIGLAVALGTIVTVWYKAAAESQIETVLLPFANEADCGDVNINVAFDYDYCYLKVYNSGTLKIIKYEAHSVPAQEPENPIVYDVSYDGYYEVLPRQWAGNVTLNPFPNGMKVEVFPIVNVGGQDMKCNKNRLFTAQEACS